jgi:outer membrane protein assembly factor BamB
MAILLVAVAAVVSATVPAITAAADQTTIAYNPLRTGWDANEPALTPGAVTASDFGRLWTTTLPRPQGQTVDTYPNQLYAQPLVANGYVIVATEENQVDALDPRTGAVLWSTSLGPAWTSPDCGDLVPHIGITSTPVYNPSSKTVYVVTKTGTTDGGADLKMHALDVTDGTERPHWPVELAGKADNSSEVLDPVTSNQRPGLLLLDGRVYLATASHCDHGAYVGYVVGVDTTTRAVHRWSDQDGSASSGAGIWQSGGGPMSDGPGRLFVATGNGVSPAPGPGNSPPGTLAESVVRLAIGTSGTMSAKDYFSPADNNELDQDDADLGSGSPVGLPDSFGTPQHRHLLVISGKDGMVRLLDRDHLGGTAQGPGHTDDVLSSVQLNGVWGRAAVFDASSSAGAQHLIYLLPSRSPMHVLQVSANAQGVPVLTDLSQTVGSFGYTSGSPIVTSNGQDPSSALVWLVTCKNASGVHAVLRAFPAIPPSGDAWLPVFTAPLRTVAKFVTPATDRGRVFVGTRDGRVFAFGAPTTAKITAPSTDFGVVQVGQQVVRDVELTAHASTTVQKVTTSGPYTADTSALPVHLARNDTLSVPVTFQPTKAEDADGVLTVTVSGGDKYLFALNGVGAVDGLAATPTSLGFRDVHVGQAASRGVTIRNTGTSSTTITAITAPSSPRFTVSGLPPAGTELGSQQSLTATVTFTPKAAGDLRDTLTVTAATGSVSIPLHGTAQVGHPRLAVRPANLDFGDVAPGQARTRTFVLTNTGTSLLKITKAPPPNPPFTVPVPVAEGQRLEPGDALRVSVRVDPTTAGRVVDSYAISSNDGRGPQLLRLVVNADPWLGVVRNGTDCLAPRSKPVHRDVGVRALACTRASAAQFVRGAGSTLRYGSSSSRWCLAAMHFTRCDGSPRQRWKWTAAGQLRSDGRCLTLHPAAMRRCAVRSGQRWDLSGLYRRRGLMSAAVAPIDQVCLAVRQKHAQLAPCRVRPSQLVTVASRVLRMKGRCLDAHGATVRLASCTATDSQRWHVRPSGEIVDGADRRCLTDPHDALAAGTRLTTATCAAKPGQVWRVP